jgi:threonine/homoserine/homoserine lactone efflux protein
MNSAALAGLALGFAVGAQVGPIWLLCLRSSLRYGFASGWAIGAGAALVDTLYAIAGVAGAAPLLQVEPVRLALGLVGAAVLAALALRTIWSAFRIRLGGETPDEVASPRRAFVTSVAATASNPMTIVSWAAIFSAASTADVVASAGGAALLLVGVGVGSLTWFTLLSAGAAIARQRIGSKVVKTIDVASGTAILGFAGLLGWRTLRG